MSKPNLFTPLTIGDVDLANRILMAPLTRTRAAEGNVPHALNATYYRQRAGAGLIISEASQVTPEGQGYLHTPGIHTDEQVEGWQLVTEAVHDAGGKIYLQLWHVGRISHPDLQPNGQRPVSSSAVKPDGYARTHNGKQSFVTPRALDTDEIPTVVQQYADGARRAKAAGFDGVEIHGANSYLIDQFLRDGVNQRTDQYGGSVENRSRFLREVTEAVVDVWGAGRVGVRLSPGRPSKNMYDSDPAALFGYAASMLNEYGLSYLHLYETTDEAREITHLIRDRFEAPLILNGGYDKERANQVIADGLADAVAFGKLFISNPDLPTRFCRDAPLTEPDPSTFYGRDEKGYTDYPTLETAVRG